MDKKVKTLIADQKLSDDQIFDALTAFISADNSDADPDGEEEDQNAEEIPDSLDQEDPEADVDAADSTKEQPDIEKLIEEGIAKALQGLSRGKKPPKVKKKKKVEAVPNRPYNFNQEYGTIP